MVKQQENVFQKLRQINKYVNLVEKVKGVEMKILRQLLKAIEKKNSWGKNELKNLILEIMVGEYKE